MFTLVDSEIAENLPKNLVDDISRDMEIINSSTAMVDGEADTGNLIIDEGDKKKATKRKSQQIAQAQVHSTPVSLYSIYFPVEENFIEYMC